MSENIQLELTVEDEEDLRPSGYEDEPLFWASWFKVTEQISRTYLLRIRVASRADSLDLKSLLGRRVMLTESRELEGSPQGLYLRRFHGVIASAQQRNFNQGLGLYTYWLDCRPALDALAMTSQCRIVGTDEPRKLPEIVNLLLTDSYSGKSPRDLDPVKAEISYEALYADPEHDYQDRSFVVQYNESDLNFFQRQLERYGVFYFFDPSGNTEKLIIADYNGAFRYTGSVHDAKTVTALHFVEPTHYASGNSFKVKNFIPRCSWRPKELTLYDYHGPKPSVNLHYDCQLDEDGEGTVSMFGGNLMPNTYDEGPLLTKRHAQLIMSDQEFFTGESDCFQLTAGFTFPLLDHFNDAYNSHPGEMHQRAYVVTEVAHECSIPLPGEAWDDTVHGHRADFTAIRAITPFRPAKVTPIPRISGAMPASIDSATDGLRADLDDRGRYLVHARFDIGEAPAGKHSHRVRMGQPYAGPIEGMGFPLRKGAEVMLGFLDGDLDRVVIQTAMPNPQNSSPLSDHIHTRSRLITASDITFEMEDGTGSLGRSGSTARQVAAPPSIAPVARAAAEPLNSGPGDESDLDRPTNSLDQTSNWARLFLSYNRQQTYLRLGALPGDEASSHVQDIGEATLPGEAGWFDYTEGDRASGTLGDKSEVIGGKQRMVVGEPGGVDGAIAEDDAGRTIVVKGGESVTIYDGQSVTVETGDQTLTARDGLQSVQNGDDFESVGWKYLATPGTGDQVLYAQGDQYLCAGGNQYQEAQGNQVFGIHGDQTGTVEGSSKIDYKSNSTTTYKGTASSMFYGASFDLFAGASSEVFAGASLSCSAGVRTEVNTAVLATANAVTSDSTLVENYNTLMRVDNCKFETASAAMAAFQRTGVYGFYQEVVDFVNMQVFM